MSNVVWFSNMPLFRNIFKKRFIYTKVYVNSSRPIQQLAVVNDEQCLYPPIIDTSKEGLQRHARQMWYDSIKALPTVEEKMYELALQQRSHLKVFQLNSICNTYVGVPFQSYITRTHVINGLPEHITGINVDQELDEIRNVFCEVLYKDIIRSWKANEQMNLSELFSKKDSGIRLLQALIAQSYKKLGRKNDYILESVIQQKTRINSFWWHSGFESEKKKLFEENLCFQYSDVAAFSIRMKQPLLPIVDMSDPLCATADVPDYNFIPNTLGFHSEREKIISVPGYWAGDPCEYPLLLVFPRSYLQVLLKKIEKYDLSKIEEGFAVMASFGWLNAIATYQGFTPFHDLTYPLVTQTILTNGRDWNFFVYQLNTIAFHSDVDKKDRRNICWSSGRMRLFDTIEDGKLKGLNDEVFKLILRFLLNAPLEREGVVLKPHLGEDLRTEEELRIFRFFFKRMYSRCPDPMAYKNEVPTWRRIYKMHPDAPPTPYIRND
ncbi:LOW QUALITY PROTEIN: 28S ribosomal protein S30, mitochondrial-like [Uloborus diversus]|uniref:LOW QUALITY PROTEIN: 28S ribosomal protein S30, mitochondrial-like n=1 Tax=Uloborus diversus TaxID=327109 RepID=UPI0024097A11|nr:LOW QUALITY PROTEIN: 28S ribosomal protein S30, mitochondrial-like [Uloborus diversus]